MSTENLIHDGPNKIVLSRLESVGSKSASAFSSCYDDTFPQALHGIVSQKEFKYCIDLINQTAEDYFPCAPCNVFGYICCLGSMGISLLLPEPCTEDLERNLVAALKIINNREDFIYRGIVWELRRILSKQEKNHVEFKEMN